MLQLQHVQLDTEPRGGHGRPYGKHAPDCVEGDLGRCSEEMTADEAAARVLPLQEAHAKDQFIALLGLFQTATHIIHPLIDVLGLSPAAHLLGPGLPPFDEVLKPCALDLRVVFQAPYLGDLPWDGVSFLGGRIVSFELSFDGDSDLREQLWLRLHVIKVILADPVPNSVRNRRPGRHASFADFQPYVRHDTSIGGEEGTATFGQVGGNIGQPKESVSLPVGGYTSPPKGSSCFQKLQEGLGLLCELSHRPGRT
jgi:hypothetical protein